MFNFHDEITRAVPIGAENKRYHGGEPIMYAFECALLERETGLGWTYTAENYVNGNKTVLCRRKKPMGSNEAVKFAELIQTSRAAGAGHWQIDRPEGERLTLPRAKEIRERDTRKRYCGTSSQLYCLSTGTASARGRSRSPSTILRRSQQA